MKALKINPLIGLIIVLIITSSVSLFGLKAFSDRDIADDWIVHSYTVISSIDQVVLSLEIMESGLNDYLITGDVNSFTAYKNGTNRYDASMERLLQITIDNPAQMTRWHEVQAQAAGWQKGWATRGMQIRHDVDAGKLPGSAALNYVKANQGQTIMDTVRAKIAEGREVETRLLAQRIQAGNTANDRANGVMVTGMSLAVLLGLITGWLMTQANTRATEQIELQRMLIEEREKERMQIARDLHDGPVQELSAASFVIQGLFMEDLNPQSEDQLKELRKAILDVVGELRGFAMELRSPVLMKFGLKKAIEAHAEAFQKNHPGIHVHVEAPPDADPLPEHCRNTLFRIYQESMNNIARHSKASEIQIQFKKTSEQAILQVQDNGIGFHLPDDWINLARQGHLGLVGMRERAEAVGGSLEIVTEPGRGTCLRSVVPLKRNNPAGR